MRKKTNFWNDRRTGMITGLLLPIVTIVGFWFFNSSGRTLEAYIRYALIYQVFTQILALCTLPNLILFFAFLRREYYESGWGVIFATGMYLVAVAFYKLL